MLQLPIETDVKKLKSMMDAGEAFTLLDVRGQDEFDTARIPGSTLIPMPTLADRVTELRKDIPLVVHCHHGGRSKRAVNWLREQGFANATNLTGGIDAWSMTIDPSVARY